MSTESLSVCIMSTGSLSACIMSTESLSACIMDTKEEHAYLFQNDLFTSFTEVLAAGRRCSLLRLHAGL